MKESLAILWRRTVNVLAIIGALTVLAIIISIIVAINRPRVRLAGQSAVRAVALAPVSTKTGENPLALDMGRDSPQSLLALDIIFSMLLDIFKSLTIVL